MIINFSNKKIKAKIIAKQSGVIAGIGFCKQAFKIIGKESIFKSKIKDGKFIKFRNFEGAPQRDKNIKWSYRKFITDIKR